jgi:hypothetical protein
MTVGRAIACVELDKIQSPLVDMEPRRFRSNPKKLISLIRQKLTGLREVILTRMPRLSMEDNSKHVITLKDARLLEKEPLDGCYLRCCEGEVDKSPNTERWIVYPNHAWNHSVYYLRRLNRERRYRGGPFQFDYFRRRILINRLYVYTRRGRYTKVGRGSQPATDLILPVWDLL